MVASGYIKDLEEKVKTQVQQLASLIEPYLKMMAGCVSRSEARRKACLSATDLAKVVLDNLVLDVNEKIIDSYLRVAYYGEAQGRAGRETMSPEEKKSSKLLLSYEELKSMCLYAIAAIAARKDTIKVKNK